jgi:hypothetical protein
LVSRSINDIETSSAMAAHQASVAGCGPNFQAASANSAPVAASTSG